MNRNKFIVLVAITGFILVGNVFVQSIPNDSLLTAHAECIEDNNDEKIKTAIELFSNYIDDNKTDWRKVQFENLDRNPVKTFDDYNIINVDIVDYEADSFTAKVTYDIKCTDESDFWFAGNGLREQDWIRNKVNFINIKKNNDGYCIKNIFT